VIDENTKLFFKNIKSNIINKVIIKGIKIKIFV